ncbi:MAG: M23 family metallopeptidase [Chloroflexota bacterium]|nr:M23 family metallopeptidase [Chloroflexota bacterium]MDE3100790.1 M23 family metallopeptidase [Chloroflexota bacterium]
MTRAAALLAAILVSASAVAADPALAAPSAATGLDCVERVPVPAVANVIDEQWSPDSRTLALTWFGRVPSTLTVAGYEEDEVIDLLDVATGSLRPLGVGDMPRWSTTGAYVSYWGPHADELRIVRDRRVVARLRPTIPEVRWVGDALLFIEGDELRRWENGGVTTVAHFAAVLVPHYPKDDVYLSADGRYLTLTRYALDGTIERYIGTTATGEMRPLDAPGAMYLEWAPVGSRLLIRYADRVELRDVPTGEARSASVASFAGPVHAWTPDGRALLMGRVSPTVPAGNAFDPFGVWGAPEARRTATLPNVLGARRFSPDGRSFVGVSRTSVEDTRLELYRCVDGGRADLSQAAPDAAARLARIDASPRRSVRPAAGDISRFVQGAHTGIDVAAPYGSLIVASNAGLVTKVGWHPAGGERVCVDDGLGLETCYYHTSLPLVHAGQRVARGEPVALIGLTGITTGPHVHWEARLFGRIVDPLTR